MFSKLNNAHKQFTKLNQTVNMFSKLIQPHAQLLHKAGHFINNKVSNALELQSRR